MTSSPAHVYDQIGRGYAAHRQPEPRWARKILAALGESRLIVNVGAGAGSYEPRDRTVVAVEPSQSMIVQRPAGAAPAIRAVAEKLPLRDKGLDASLALLTIHHWRDVAAGVAELKRVARRHVVLTWDPAVVIGSFWFARDYVPEAVERERDLPTVRDIIAIFDLPNEQFVLPVPHDCSDGVFAAYWARPEAYLDPAVRGAMSAMSLLDERIVERAVGRLRNDLADGRWDATHGELRNLTEMDLGYRLLVFNEVES